MEVSVYLCSAILSKLVRVSLIDFGGFHVHFHWAKAPKESVLIDMVECKYKFGDNVGILEFKKGHDVMLSYKFSGREDEMRNWARDMDPEVGTNDLRKFLGRSTSPLQKLVKPNADFMRDLFELKTKLEMYEQIGVILNHPKVKNVGLMWNGKCKFNVDLDELPPH